MHVGLVVTESLNFARCDMRYFVKEWSDKTASLVAEDGYILETYQNSEDAVDACIKHCMVEPDFEETLHNKSSCHYIEQPHRLC